MAAVALCAGVRPRVTMGSGVYEVPAMRMCETREAAASAAVRARSPSSTITVGTNMAAAALAMPLSRPARLSSIVAICRPTASDDAAAAAAAAPAPAVVWPGDQ